MSFEVSHSRPLRHSSDLIKGTRCNGCRCMSVIVRHRFRETYEEYWCDHFHMCVKPFEVECSFTPRKVELKKYNRKPYV